MSIIGIILLVLGFFAALFVYEILDRWHQRKAWREATRLATEILKREDRP